MTPNPTLIAEAVPLWIEARQTITNRRPRAQADNRRKAPLPSVDDLLKEHDIRGRTFAELRVWASYERAIREQAHDRIGKVRRSA